MKIRYSKSRIFLNGALGATFAIFGALKVFEGTADYFHYVQLLLGVLMVFSFFFERKFGYLTIEDGILTKYSLRKKSISLTSIHQIQSLPGRIKLVTAGTNLSINTSVIDKESINDLYPILGSLELKSHNNPFSGWSRTRTAKE
ncbi:hypothetical protein [Salinimicrobium oceani]|uniref:PH domain-containing protein n=1 Tax=Salinimicrobium oceani TaxID=2722702 RepID=A0ABX1CVC0_9FLAO|nr:hypothetical protein [Salinimicrobium oceani]NJW51299.1 hypothetical protein [Salinimicrobium oceani]